MYRSVKIHADPPSVSLTKSKTNKNSEKDYAKIKLRINPSLETSDIYEFKMDLFDNDNLEEFLLSKQDY